ncbi:ABC transporter permease [Granulicoccus phenolivorans]|uniref:ABC transporter permease n=1 Tax=Granulicoccus phenolivorans TaxID=266854 RepID=UPI000405ADA2|nr:ABC transporter permease [Granulicoccus phenolivorans]
MAATQANPDVAVKPDQALTPGVDDRLRTPRAKRANRWGLGRLIGPLLVLIAWAAVTWGGLVDSSVLPSPSEVGAAAGRLLAAGTLQQHLLISLSRAMIGLGIGVVAGTGLALVAGLFRWGENLVDANMQMARAMPILALVPLAIVWLGIGEEVKIFLVALGVTFPMYLNTHAAIRAVDARYLDLGRTLGLSRLELIRTVVLPGALPGFFTGLRFAASVCWLVLVVSEQINASSGIGYLMTQARGISATDVIVVGLIVYALLGLLSDTLVRFLEGKALAWRSTFQYR